MAIVYLDMGKDERFREVRWLIWNNYVTTFREIFLYTPVASIADPLNIQYDRLVDMIDWPEKYQFIEFIRISELLQISVRKIIELVCKQFEVERKKEFDVWFERMYNQRQSKKWIRKVKKKTK